MNRQVDIWGGVDGFAERWDGYLVSDTPQLTTGLIWTP